MIVRWKKMILDLNMLLLIPFLLVPLNDYSYFLINDQQGMVQWVTGAGSTGHRGRRGRIQ